MYYFSKMTRLILSLALSQTLYSMSTFNELVFYEKSNLPIRDAITHIVKTSGKRVVFDSQIEGTSSFSINGVPWRNVLNSFLEVHNLSINESKHAIFIQKDHLSEKVKNLSLTKKDDVSNSRKLSSVVKSSKVNFEDELEIKGVSGSNKNLKAIVNYRGRNQTWSVGNVIDAKYRVIKIEEDGLTVLDLNRNDEVIVKFY